MSVADNRALLRYDDRLISYYLNERTILSSVDTFHLGDIDQLSYLEDRLDQFQIKPVQDHDIVWQSFGGRRPKTCGLEAVGDEAFRIFCRSIDP